MSPRRDERLRAVIFSFSLGDSAWSSPLRKKVMVRAGVARFRGWHGLSGLALGLWKILEEAKTASHHHCESCRQAGRQAGRQGKMKWVIGQLESEEAS